MRGVRASGRGEAASACEVQSVPPGPASAVASSSLLLAGSLQSSRRGVRRGFKAKWIQICRALLSLRVFYVSFIEVLHKEHRIWHGFMSASLKVRVWCIACRKNVMETRV